jgi:hypothetical protein
MLRSLEPLVTARQWHRFRNIMGLAAPHYQKDERAKEQGIGQDIESALLSQEQQRTPPTMIAATLILIGLVLVTGIDSSESTHLERDAMPRNSGIPCCDYSTVGDEATI